MLKKVLVGVSIFLMWSAVVQASCNDNKNSYQNYEQQYTNYRNLWYSASYSNPDYQYYYDEYQRLYALYKTEYSNYVSCRARISDLFDQGYDSYYDGKYQSAISYYTQYLSDNGDVSDSNYKSARSNLVKSYLALAGVYFDKKDWDNSILNYLGAVSLDDNNFSALYSVGSAYYNKGDYQNSLKYYQMSYDIATSTDDISDSKEALEKTRKKIDVQNAKSNAPSNDPLSYLQYYLKDLNIGIAWQQVTNPKQVVVAIIDDGINVNHPDLSNSIWVAPNSDYGSSKIIDFVGDKIPNNLPTGEHGTMVAGIIGATINNNEGIAGIAKKVKLMPLRVFPLEGGAKEENILKALNYAIDNGANIINLSLGQSQFAYSKKYDEVIKKAYDLGIAVVIAAGNGDLLTNQDTGVNLDLNPIAPVCNNGDSATKFSFGVYATNSDGYRTGWTNYGKKCTPYWAPGEGIVSTSIPVFNGNYGANYNALDGTSFSAPIVSGIIALGYNKFGKVPLFVVASSLTSSTTLNKNNQPVLDANKYLNSIQGYYDKQSALKLSLLRQKAQAQFDKYKKQYNTLSSSNKKSKYQSLLVITQKRSKILKGDNLTINNILIDLIEQELASL